MDKKGVSILSAVAKKVGIFFATADKIEAWLDGIAICRNSNMSIESKTITVEKNDLVSAVDRINQGSIKDGYYRRREVAPSEGKIDVEKHVCDHFLKHIELKQRGEYVPTKKECFNEAVRSFDRYFVVRFRATLDKMKGNEDACLGLMPWIFECPKATDSEISDWMNTWNDDGKRYTWCEMVARNEYPAYRIAFSPFWLYGDKLTLLSIAIWCVKK